MSKKWIVFMLFVCAGFAGVIGYTRMQADGKGPEITYDADALPVYRPGMRDVELLKGVTAVDEKEGDVSDSLTVEAVYEIDASSVAVVYAAKDSRNNITKLKCTLEMLPETEKAEGSEKEAASQEESGSKEAAASQEKSGSKEEAASQEKSGSKEEDASQEKSPEQSELSEENDKKEAENEAEQIREEQEAAANAMPAQNPRLYLTEYVVNVPVGASVDLLSYVREITDDIDDIYALWRKIQIVGEVNTAAAGTYECTYYVVDSQENVSNQAVLTVIVE